MRGRGTFIGWTGVFAFFMLVLATGEHAVAQQETLLHSFNLTGNSGADVVVGVISDAAGNLYGVTGARGGSLSGNAFELVRGADGSWTEKTIHDFNATLNDGEWPDGSLIFDAAGNLYGTTYYGGRYNMGTAFELVPQSDGSWKEKILHHFGATSFDGTAPRASLTFDPAGNLYGTTFTGGADNDGTVFELTPRGDGSWTEKILHAFNGKNGAYLLAGLAMDPAGDLYGVTISGGPSDAGNVFELMPVSGGGWIYKVLHNFNLSGDGEGAFGTPILDAAGNLYGTTTQGGSFGYGTVYALKRRAGGQWVHRILHNFANDAVTGIDPYASLIFDAAGNLYGTAEEGGAYNGGVVFELMPRAGGGWTEVVLHNFNPGGGDGEFPLCALIFDSSGNLYGTTDSGGAYGYGTVFKLTP